MDEFLEQFLLECREQAQDATANLLTLEKSPGDIAVLDNVFRAFHTIKGGAGIVEFDAMVQLVHGAETDLAQAKSGRRSVDISLINACLQCIDQVTRWLDLIERTGGLPDDAAMRATTMVAAPVHAVPAAAAVTPRVEAPVGEHAVSQTARALLVAQLALLAESTGTGVAGRVAGAGTVAANVLRSLGRDDDAAEVERVTAICVDAGRPDALSRLLSAQLQPEGPRGGAPEAAGEVTPAQQAPEAETISRTLRIDIGRVDALVRLTGELTVASNAIGHLAHLDGDEIQLAGDLLRQRYQVLERLIGQLQRSVLGIRVLPLRTVFQRFQRLAREISAELDKTVELTIEGGDTEADKSIVEMLFEPLLHVLRNAVDHGIEDATQRHASGKPPVAAVLIRAFREADNVIVEVVDDGRGVDIDRVRELAGKRGLFSKEVLDVMSDQDVINIIFLPGFSTTDSVTRLSGRGVGMDAVRHAVERFGGRVGIASRRGLGTTVRITLPFSAMMTRIMVVTAGGQRFGVPFDAVVETAQVGASAIASIGSSQAVVLRNRTIPVVDLAAFLTLDSTFDAKADAILVIARVNGQSCALRVDKVGERLDVLLNRLDGLLAGTQGITGSTLLGDGSVLLILDLGAVF